MYNWDMLFGTLVPLILQGHNLWRHIISQFAWPCPQKPHEIERRGQALFAIFKVMSKDQSAKFLPQTGDVRF